MGEKESKFQSDLIKELKEIFPGCEVMKQDSGYVQGVPDLVIFYGPHWAMLECKRKRGSKKQSNQDWYVDRFNDMSFARFINPQNKKEVLYDLQQAFGIKGKARAD